MNTHPTRWLALLTLVLTVGGAASLALAQRGPGDGDGFGPRDGEAGPPVFEESEDRRRGDRERRGFRLSDEDLDAAYDIVVRLYPEMTERLDTLRAEDPGRFKQELERGFPRVRFLIQLEKRDPAMFELRMQDVALDHQTRQLAKALREARKADDKNRYEDLRDEIEDKITEHFDIRQQIRAMEIEKLKQKIEELEQDLDDRDDDKKDLIEARVTELAGAEW